MLNIVYTLCSLRLLNNILHSLRNHLLTPSFASLSQNILVFLTAEKQGAEILIFAYFSLRLLYNLINTLPSKLSFPRAFGGGYPLGHPINKF